MFKRIVSGLLVGSVVIVTVLFLPKFVCNVLCALIAVMGISEFIKAMEKGGYRPIKTIPYLTCLGLLFVNTNSSILAYKFSFSIFSFLILGILIYGLFSTKRTLVDVSLSIFSILYIPFLLSFLLSTFYVENIGTYLIWFVLFGACLSDAFAYFVGVKFGKHKLCPSISPKKTVEGAVGAIIGTAVVFFAYAVFLNKYHYFDIQYWQIILFGAVSSVFAQVGDLIASSIKRFVGAKDFGSIMPGHGGILDRIDSVLFVAPVIYYGVLMFESLITLK